MPTSLFESVARFALFDPSFELLDSLAEYDAFFSQLGLLGVHYIL